jgi:hypothetical protein
MVFSVQSDQTGVEYWMNTLLGWKFESYGHQRDDFCDFKWAVALGC